jgi:hypothetical protein
LYDLRAFSDFRRDPKKREADFAAAVCIGVALDQGDEIIDGSGGDACAILLGHNDP